MRKDIIHFAPHISRSRGTRAEDARGSWLKSIFRDQVGFTLAELLLAVAIIGVLAAIAYPSYVQYVDKARNAIAVSDIAMISQVIARFEALNNRLPDNLAEVHMDGFLDPWGHSYQYLRIAGAGLKGKGGLRKDKSLVPINSDYDLYSKGKDGDSVAPLTAKSSRDDIVRANNGSYIGLAADY